MGNSLYMRVCYSWESKYFSYLFGNIRVILHILFYIDEIFIKIYGIRLFLLREKNTEKIKNIELKLYEFLTFSF